ncbi:DUF3597 domain-containing protein [Teichococcus oryzae]|jgi:3-oxoacyl-ACP reductase-like protein|uniref:DUF3597 domain-containing protein n=1 Tax=Teichococcus oryzae TaxID=1608942 RepID=A0A5B2TLX6_9PROT|nr:DUF3597 domain-containing protein [Pseudoroseomonas oryzae]KAA2214938.1 DUF3597 domain-containing protein [Pseudoroseomonas oryzae]
MSVFGSILSKIFGQRGANAAPSPTAPVSDDVPKPTAADAQPGAAGAATPPVPGTAPAASGAAAATPAPMQQVDVAAVLTEMASKNPQQLNWRQSIVDLMKLLGLDSSLDNRKELARELGYSGDMNDSASMNIWLHKQVMNKLAENGGQVPAELRD